MESISSSFFILLPTSWRLHLNIQTCPTPLWFFTPLSTPTHDFTHPGPFPRASRQRRVNGAMKPKSDSLAPRMKRPATGGATVIRGWLLRDDFPLARPKWGHDWKGDAFSKAHYFVVSMLVLWGVGEFCWGGFLRLEGFYPQISGRCFTQHYRYELTS